MIPAVRKVIGDSKSGCYGPKLDSTIEHKQGWSCDFIGGGDCWEKDHVLFFGCQRVLVVWTVCFMSRRLAGL